MSGTSNIVIADEVRRIAAYFENNVIPMLASPLPRGVIAKEKQNELEAHTRTYLIDEVLTCLGWNLRDPSTIIVEDPIESLPALSRVSPGESRRIDYHGVERVGTLLFSSLLVIEAKKLRSALPDPLSADVLELSSFFAKAVESRRILSNLPERVPKIWTEWIDSVIDYVERVEHAYGTAPSCAAITNGNWYIIFTNPRGTFIEGNQSISDIVVFRDLGEVHRSVTQFYDAISYERLRSFVPPQHVQHIGRFINGGEAVKVTFATRLSYGRAGPRQPVLLAATCAWLYTSKYGWVIFEMDFEEDFIQFRNGTEDMIAVIKELSTRRDNFLVELRRHIRPEVLEPSAVADRRVNGSTLTAARPSPEQLICRTDENHYLLAVGSNATFLKDDHTYENCRFHDYGACLKEGQGAADGPILKSSINPPAFFVSGSPFHCANASVHVQRANKCLLAPFERFLCCRKCTYFDHCWPDGGSTLPCQSEQPHLKNRWFTMRSTLERLLALATLGRSILSAAFAKLSIFAYVGTEGASHRHKPYPARWLPPTSSHFDI